MQKLIPRGKLQNFDPSTIELVSPFFATSIVEFHLSSTSSLFGLPELIRGHTPQRFLEGEDKWQVGGKSWHWQPVTPDEAYEKKGGEK